MKAQWQRLALVLALVGMVSACGKKDEGSPAVGGSGAPVVGGGASGTGSGGTGGGKVANVLQPIAEGLEWTYEFVSDFAPCPKGEAVMKVTGKVPQPGGPDYFVVQSLSGSAANMCLPMGGYRNDGEALVLLLDKWYPMLDAKIEKGHKWEHLYGKFEYSEARSEVKVPAGTFKDCWVRLQPTEKIKTTFCRGVGLVEVEGPDFKGQLTKKNF